MSTPLPPFRARAVRPTECISAGWQLVKGEHYLLMVGISAVGILLGSLAPMAILLGPMMCGLYLCMFARMRGERPSFDLLFKGFDLFLPALLVTLLNIVPVIVILVPAYFVFFIGAFAVVAATGRSEQGQAALPVVMMCGIGVFVLFILALSLGLAVAFAFAYPLVADRRLGAWDAVRASARAAAANVGGILGLLVLNGLLGLLGVLACYVGAFFVMPINMAASAVAYRSVFPEELRPDASPDARTSD